MYIYIYKKISLDKCKKIIFNCDDLLYSSIIEMEKF